MPNHDGPSWAGIDYATVFAAAPTAYLLLLPDLTIADANEAYSQATGRSRQELLGREIFDVFPANPDDPTGHGGGDLRASLLRVLSTGRSEAMAVLRYDIPARDQQGFVERYWSPVTAPVKNAQGRVVALLHRVIDVTEFVRQRGQIEALRADVQTEHQRLAEVEADLFARGQQLEELNRQLRQAQEELTARALHDPLTRLVLRPVLLEHLDRSLSRLTRHRGSVTVLFADLDELKRVNDTYGHSAGDELIRSCAQRMKEAVRPTDVVARVGGDEFVVLLDNLPDVTGPGGAMAVAERILEHLRAPLAVEAGVVVHPSASIGLATLTHIEPGQTAAASAAQLLIQADTAMYTAKRSGRGRVSPFDPAAHEAVTARQRMERDLQLALPGDQLELYYQPIIDVGTRQVHAMEALLRWNHPSGRMHTAADFIDVAEHGGLLVDIGRWVIHEACAQLAAWDLAHPSAAPQQLYLNLSASELMHPHLRDHVDQALESSGLGRDRLVFEITETSALDESTSSLAMDALRALGCDLAIDDFGTGYSTLSRLVHFPGNVVKIDKSFIRDLPRDHESVAVVAAVLTLAHNLRKTVVAEGVEDRATLVMLEELGCTYAQGYYLGRPLPAPKVAEQHCSNGIPMQAEE